MRDRLLALLGAAGLAVLLWPQVASAQTVGIIAGHVYDQAGVPLRGVRVVASSETQIGGPRSATTDDQGFFRIPGLMPGRFTVTASAPKLKSLVHSNVRVAANTTTELDLVLEVETAVEQVKVVEKAPPVDLTRAGVGDTFDQDFVDKLPLATRDYQGVMALTPGVSDTTGTGNPQVRGGSYFNNSYTIDGFQTTDPVTHTFGQNFSFDAISQLQVQTAGFGAENSGTLGGAANIVTRSGSNRLEVDGTVDFTDHHLRFFKDARDIGTFRATAASVNVGGPVIKDRLWYFVSAEGINNVFTLPRDPVFPDHPSRSVLALNAIGKLSWQLTPRHKLELRLTYSPADFNNVLQSPLVEPEAEALLRQSTKFAGLNWHALLSDDLYLITRAGFTEEYLETAPQSCKWDPEGCDDIAGELDLLSGVLRRNYVRHSKEYRRMLEIGGNLEWFKDMKKLGTHGIKLGATFLGSNNPVIRTVPGDVFHRNVGTEAFSRTEFCSNDPKLDNGECRHNWQHAGVEGTATQIFLQDAFKPTRYLTITPGASLHIAKSRDDKAHLVTDITAATPHLQLVWDATHDGKTAIRASIENRVDTGFLALARFTSRQLYSKVCDWDAEAKAYIRNCRSSGGDGGTTVGRPCGPNGLNPDGSSCETTLRPPRQWEYVLGAEREILTGITLGADLIYRKFIHQWEDLETNALWNLGGTDLRREGRWRTDRAEFVFDLETPDEARRDYRGVTVALRKREGILRTMLSYTWSKYEGTEDNSFASLFMDNPGQNDYYFGPLAADSRHDVRAHAIYQLRPWVSVGGSYQFISGGPYNRYFFDPVYGEYIQFQARRGFDSRGNLDPDDDTPLRLPDISELSLQVRFNLRSIVKQHIEVFADVFNILALRTSLAVIEQDGPFWGRAISRMPPTRARLGLRYRF